MQHLIQRAADIALSSNGLSEDQALELIQPMPDHLVVMLMAQANRVRHETLGDNVELCAIVNARSGRCTEDCRFCAQSVNYKAQIDIYPLMETSDMLEHARAARSKGVRRFSIVTSGRGVSRDRELERIAETLGKIADLGLSPCASLGILDTETAEFLKSAGMVTYHHNLETAPSFFPQICTSHTMDERIATARAVKKAGLRLCCGGIVGLGEPLEARVELALTIRDLEPDSVPLNFLNPIPGTPLAEQSPLTPMQVLQTIAVFRLIMPRTAIRTCGGREKNLRGLQAMMFTAGANATMTGNYLTTEGRRPEDDIQDIQDLGLQLKV
jgi:biotin synthase